MTNDDARRFSVITTIQPPTAAVRALGVIVRRQRSRLLVIGDSKGPFAYEMEGAELYTLPQQKCLPFHLAKLLPERHYTRKNIGYILAISEGATSIYETDDDNAPLDNWRWREEETSAGEVRCAGWVNVYKAFTAEHIWPRGLPLEFCREPLPVVAADTGTARIRAPIQQGLANGSPDVDAVWRLVLDRDFAFDAQDSVCLRPGAWCPFNSQSTWWWPVAYPLMYLPSNCSFRMTDIWRSFIAQRCLWELDLGVVFHAPEVVQDRNAHRYIKDFEDEIAGYLGNDKIRRLLDAVKLDAGDGAVKSNMQKCYALLIKEGVFPADELILLDGWFADLAAIGVS